MSYKSRLLRLTEGRRPHIERPPAMENFRDEVRTFMRAAEIILSPASLSCPLTSQERDVIFFYAQSLVEQLNAERAQSHS